MLLLTLTLISTLCASLVVADEDADVLILGAGMAGQAAAAFFMEKNVSFLIIEGAAEHGGRMKSEMFGGRMVEAGSTGIYALNTTIQSMVDMYNISGMYADFESVVVRTHENTEPEAEADASWDRLITAQKKVKELYNMIKDGRIPDMSARVALEYGNWFPKTPVDDVIEVYDYDYEFAKIPETISTYGIESAQPYQDKPFFSNDQRGLQNILEKISRDDSRLKLNEVVTKISDTGSSVSVSTKSGKTFTGKYAIVTFSMGVLKSGSVTFEPTLPDWKLDTIYKTSMDHYTQMYVTFPMGTSSYWGTDQFVLYASPRRLYYPILWNLEAANFSPEGKPMISFHLMGEEARRVERLNDTLIKAEVTDVLKKMFGSGAVEPDDIMVTRWSQNPLTMGSFSSRHVGSHMPIFLDALQSRVGRVHFAGDAYSDTMDGFLAGALESGKKSAMNVYNCMMDAAKCHQFNPDAYKPKPPQQPTCGTSVNIMSLSLLAASAITTLL